MTDNCILVLQDCVDLDRCVPGPCSEIYQTSSHDADQALNIKVEKFSDIQDEEDPVPKPFPAIKPEVEVSCTSV
jgi:hypothetical protein